MTEIEKKALALLNECAGQEVHGGWKTFDPNQSPCTRALCRAIEELEAEKAARAAEREQHEAFRQEVSDACKKWTKANVNCREPHDLDRFIIAKPDPMDLVADDMMLGAHNPRREWGAELRAAIEKRGGKIVWGEG